MIIAWFGGKIRKIWLMGLSLLLFGPIISIERSCSSLKPGFFGFIILAKRRICNEEKNRFYLN